jgi:hypothetical protein
MYRVHITWPMAEILGKPFATYREALDEQARWVDTHDGQMVLEVQCPVHGWSRVMADGTCLPCYAQLAEECGDDETIWGYDPD